MHLFSTQGAGGVVENQPVAKVKRATTKKLYVFNDPTWGPQTEAALMARRNIDNAIIKHKTEQAEKAAKREAQRLLEGIRSKSGTTIYHSRY